VDGIGKCNLVIPCAIRDFAVPRRDFLGVGNLRPRFMPCNTGITTAAACSSGAGRAERRSWADPPRKRKPGSVRYVGDEKPVQVRPSFMGTGAGGIRTASTPGCARYASARPHPSHVARQRSRAPPGVLERLLSDVSANPGFTDHIERYPEHRRWNGERMPPRAAGP